MLRTDRGTPLEDHCRVLAPSLDAWIQLLVHGPALNPEEDGFLTELGGRLVDPIRNPKVEEAWAAMMTYRAAVAARLGGVSCFASLEPSPAQVRAVDERFNAL